MFLGESENMNEGLIRFPHDNYSTHSTVLTKGINNWVTVSRNTEMRVINAVLEMLDRTIRESDKKCPLPHPKGVPKREIRYCNRLSVTVNPDRLQMGLICR